MGTAGTWTQSQSTDVPTGQGFATSLKLDCTTADTSIDSGNIIYIEQRVEGQNLQYLKKLIQAFGLKLISSLGGTLPFVSLGKTLSK